MAKPMQISSACDAIKQWRVNASSEAWNWFCWKVKCAFTWGCCALSIMTVIQLTPLYPPFMSRQSQNALVAWIVRICESWFTIYRLPAKHATFHLWIVFHCHDNAKPQNVVQWGILPFLSRTHGRWKLNEFVWCKMNTYMHVPFLIRITLSWTDLQLSLWNVN